MSSVTLLPTFIYDLQTQSDANFARRVFMKLFDGDGAFRKDVDDHRYHGIADAWIRYVSRGATAYRVIYIRNGERVYLYRAGAHSVEDRLAPPRLSEGGAGVGGEAPPRRRRNTLDGDDERRGHVICSLRSPTLMQAILARSLYPHREVALVSPFITLSLLNRTAKLGRMLDRLKEDGSRIILVTRPPEEDAIAPYVDLEARGFELHFHSRLHAKLYSFISDTTRPRPYGQPAPDFIALGSANLTEKGFAGTREEGNEELSYSLPLADRSDVEGFLAMLALQSFDLTGLRLQYARTRRRR